MIELRLINHPDYASLKDTLEFPGNTGEYCIEKNCVSLALDPNGTIYLCGLGMDGIEDSAENRLGFVYVDKREDGDPDITIKLVFVSD